MPEQILDLREHFSRFLHGQPGRLHFAAHSHHPWPDVSFDAQQQAWLDAAERMDGKWDRILGEVLPAAQAHIARQLNLPDPASIAFAPNTHEFVLRLASCLPSNRPWRVLTTDSEFHSFARQLARWEEAGLAQATRIPVEDFADFAVRFAEAASSRPWDLIYLSQCFFNSGFAIDDLDALLPPANHGALLVVDGYHGFMARPTDLSAIADRAFYIAGGYKYAMAGEGVCFMHCPPGIGKRPVNTGWYAGFGELARGEQEVDYAADGRRFAGSTFDPSGLYRFNAVQDWLVGQALDAAAVHAHAAALQIRFLDRLTQRARGPLSPESLIPPKGALRGNFLCFRDPRAGAWKDALAQVDVITDSRGDRLRFGFGIYQTEAELDALIDRIGAARV